MVHKQSWMGISTINERIKVIKMLWEAVGFHVENRRRNFHTVGVKKIFTPEQILQRKALWQQVWETEKGESWGEDAVE